MEVSCLSTEEFQIKTEVKLDTEKAEKEYKDFINNKKNKINIPISIDTQIDDLGKDINNSLKKLGKKLNNDLQINKNTIQDIEKLDNVLKNLKVSINAIESTNIKIFNIDGFNPKLLNDNINNIENYVKKVEDGYEKINKASQKIKKDSKEEKIQPQIDSTKALEQLDRFKNKLESLRYEFKNLDIELIGSGNVRKIENKINSMIQDAETRVSKGLKAQTPDTDFEVKNIREQLKLLRKIQTQYNNFKIQKINLGELVDTDSLNQIDDVFKDIIHRIASMDKLNLDFNFDALLNSLKNVNKELKRTSTDFLGVKKIASDFKSEIASYTLGEALGEATTDFMRDIGHSYIELDRSMREIKKVANPIDVDSKGELNEIRKEAISIAKDVGMASSDVQNSIASALQAGIGGMKESIEVAKQSIILANVGDMTQDSASKAINTVVKSFQLSPLKSYQLEVGNTVKKTTELKNAMDMMNYAG